MFVSSCTRVKIKVDLKISIKVSPSILTQWYDLFCYDVFRSILTSVQFFLALVSTGCIFVAIFLYWNLLPELPDLILPSDADTDDTIDYVSTFDANPFIWVKPFVYVGGGGGRGGEDCNNLNLPWMENSWPVLITLGRKSISKST